MAQQAAAAAVQIVLTVPRARLPAADPDTTTEAVRAAVRADPALRDAIVDAVLASRAVRLAVGDGDDVTAALFAPAPQTLPPRPQRCAAAADVAARDVDYRAAVEAGRDHWQRASALFVALEQRMDAADPAARDMRAEMVGLGHAAYAAFDAAYWQAASVPLDDPALDRATVTRWAVRRLAMRKSIPMALFVAGRYVEALNAVEHAHWAADELLESEEDRAEVYAEMKHLVDRILPLLYAADDGHHHHEP